MTDASLRIRPVESRTDLDRFINLQWSVNLPYRNWIPPFRSERRKILDRSGHPFYLDADAEFFLAERGSRVVGRIAAIHNRSHNREHSENIGFFGFFECAEDGEAARGLLETAGSWLKKFGATRMRGPASPSVNYEYGLLVEGFDDTPAVMMAYNPPYYGRLIESAGLRKAKDLYAYRLEEEKFRGEKMMRVVGLLRQRQGVTIRALRMDRFDEELGLILHLYRTAWQYNWGAVPMSDAEFRFMAKELKPVLRPELVLFSESAGETTGFSLSLPDYNQILRNNRKGWLLPALLRILLFRKNINRVRILTLGVLPDRLRSGAGSLLLYETGKRAVELGYPIGEAGWVLEDNTMMNRAAEFMSAVRSKVYRIYEKPL